MDARAQTDDIDENAAVAPALLRWYDAHARSLPWRAPPGQAPADPYHVWLSEVMLQQTTVMAVKPYFARFLAAWPTVADLAAAPEDAVMAAWAGLGYYARARKLVECARAVAALGAFPDEEAGLLALPGIGPYTAAAVAAIAFGRRAVVVDGNVERVVARLFAMADPLPGARPRIRELTDAITPDSRPGDFAQAMMDLGATICTPRSPKCLLCPLSAGCRARAAGTPEAYPVKAAKVKRPTRTGHAFWITRRDGAEVWLVRRPGRGLLGGMRALPDDGWTARADGHGVWEGGSGTPLGSVRHVFTHFELTLQVAALTLAADDPRLAFATQTGEEAAGETGAGEHRAAGGWWPVTALAAAGLPTVFARAAALAMAMTPGEVCDER